MTTRSIRTRSAEILLDDVGQREPAMIFLHYWGGSARTWDPVRALLPPSVRTVALNQRGWGGSRAVDERYDLDALADDVTDVAKALGIKRYILVGHSMGGKVAQILAGRLAPGLVGLVLVAPAPPTPMHVPAEARAGMVASYQSREGALEALKVLAGPTLTDEYREQVIEDTLRGDANAKRAWPEQGMVEDISAALWGVDIPVHVLVGEHDQVEREAVLRPLFASYLPGATLTTVPDVGHLMPLEAPLAIAAMLRNSAAIEVSTAG